MKIFVFNTNEFTLLDGFLHEQLQTDFKFHLSSTHKNLLIYIIRNKIAAVAVLFLKNENNLPHLYKVDIRHIAKPDARTINFFPLNNDPSHPLSLSNIEIEEALRLIYKTEYSFNYYFQNGEDLFLKEQKKLLTNKPNTKDNEASPASYKVNLSNISEPHIRTQYLLKHIADIVGLDCFIAKNDQNKHYNGELLNYKTMQDIPYNTISREALNIISLIDVIWFKDDAPFAAFEVETTTSISSGLLRFSDLVYELNHLPINLYILTTKNREQKLKKELNRSIFKKAGISQRCNVIFIDELERLYSLVFPLKGYIKNNLLDRISYDFSYFQSN